MVSIFRNKTYVLFPNIVMGSIARAILPSIKNLDLIQLDISYNNKIKDISFMKNLKILNAYGNTELDQDSIKNLDLIELDVSYNDKINNIFFMKNLKKNEYI